MCFPFYKDLPGILSWNKFDTFRGICPTELYDKIMSLKVDKSALDIPRRCIKYAANHIYEALSMVFNRSLLQGIFSTYLYTLYTNPNFRKNHLWTAC